jgi:D-galactarate dehydratase / Altronate hydrolase, C terminus
VLHFLTSSTRHFELLRLATIIDVDAGAIISGEKSIAQSGADILDFVIKVSSGEIQTKAEGKGQEDFIPWKRGISLISAPYVPSKLICNFSYPCSRAHKSKGIVASSSTTGTASPVFVKSILFKYMWQVSQTSTRTCAISGAE